MTKLAMTLKEALQVHITNERGKSLITDAPKIHGGLEQDFSPIDLVTAGLGSCILTIMSLHAKKLGVSVEGTDLTIEKIMSLKPPRRIVKMVICITWPCTFSPQVIEKLKDAIHNCPVHHSLHPEIVIEEKFYAAQK